MLTLNDIKQLALPTGSGSYQFLDDRGLVLYVGKAINLKARILSYWQKSTELTPLKLRMLAETAKITWKITDSEIEALLLEANLIKKYQPPYNINLRDDKRFTYIKITTDELPKVIATRQIDKNGKYYGPFISARAVTETLRTIRKIWPFCTQGKIGQRPCFYYQVGRCSGACGGVITRAAYLRQIIRPITHFLEGGKSDIIKSLERQIKSCLKKGETEAAANLQWRLKQLQVILDGAKVLSVADKYENDVVELAKVLGLKKVPARIEGYDLSTSLGKQSVGSLVVFIDGEAEPSQYRCFKIKGDCPGDTDMLKEVLSRRLHRDWPLPDLLLIDGGRAQLNTALSVLRQFNLALEVVAISKGEGLRSAKAPDKLFFPGQSKPLELPLNSSALHVLKRVRDEAHRFAIGYHRRLRHQAFWEQHLSD